MPGFQIASYHEILKNRNLLAFWLGFTFSSVGDSLTRVALIWFVYEKTGSALPGVIGTQVTGLRQAGSKKSSPDLPG
jgi:hypothetical protein